MTDTRTAVIFGASGIIGRAIAENLLATGGWRVVGVARNPIADIPGLDFVACDLTDPASCQQALAGIAAEHAYFTTWARRPTEHENCEVNGGMVRNAIAGVAAAGTLKHVALVTGLKHYLGPFDNYAKTAIETPFTEDMPRVPGENFYYAQEDELFAAAEKHGFTWSVARPHTVIGYAPGNQMNLGTSIAVYAAIAKETGLPFQFPGTPQQHDGLVDVTDARLLASHMIWEANTPAAADTAFNVVNGDVFRWRRMWTHIADWFGLEAAPYPGKMVPLVEYLADAGPVWDRIVAQHGLKPNPIDAVAPWWHVDLDLGRTMETMADMSLSRERGFTGYQRSSGSFIDLFERLRRERIIP
ncbi:MAG: SDR family oxidoreductase [Bauldia litoralis]